MIGRCIFSFCNKPMCQGLSCTFVYYVVWIGYVAAVWKVMSPQCGPLTLIPLVTDSVSQSSLTLQLTGILFSLSLSLSLIVSCSADRTVKIWRHYKTGGIFVIL